MLFHGLWKHYKLEKFYSKSQDKFQEKKHTKKDEEKGKNVLEEGVVRPGKMVYAPGVQKSVENALF